MSKCLPLPVSGLLFSKDSNSPSHVRVHFDETHKSHLAYTTRVALLELVVVVLIAPDSWLLKRETALCKTSVWDRNSSSFVAVVVFVVDVDSVEEDVDKTVVVVGDDAETEETEHFVDGDLFFVEGIEAALELR